MLGELSPEAEVEVVDLNEFEMAIYSGERESEHGVPTLAKDLFDKIGAADAILISFAEHNGSHTAAWKNTYDWMSRIDSKVFQGKPVAMLAATPGPRSGAGVLGGATMTAPFFGAELVGHLGVGRFPESFDAEAGQLADAELDGSLRQLLTDLIGRG